MAIVHPQGPVNPNPQTPDAPVAPMQSPAIPGSPPGTEYGHKTPEELAREKSGDPANRDRDHDPKPAEVVDPHRTSKRP